MKKIICLSVLLLVATVAMFADIARPGKTPYPIPKPGSNTVSGLTIHFDSNGKADGEGVVRPLPNGGHADDGFHVYGFEWLPGEMIFFIDGVETYRQQRAIDKRMYILVNLAIGSVELFLGKRAMLGLPIGDEALQAENIETIAGRLRHPSGQRYPRRLGCECDLIKKLVVHGCGVLLRGHMSILTTEVVRTQE